VKPVETEGSAEAADGDGSPDVEEESPNAPIAVWQREAGDGRGNARAAGDVREKVTMSLPERAELSQLECRATICYVRIVFQDASAKDDFQHQILMGKHNWPGPISFEPAGTTRDGRTMLDCYFGTESGD
jgi:hypothetical protein